jgi:hypothetical protein
MRSKRNVLLVLLAAMTAIFAAGIVWHVLRPDPAERALRDVPVYPGAREVPLSPSEALGWENYVPQGSARQVRYAVPRGTTRAAVFSFYAHRMTPKWRLLNPSCYARGDTRVVVLTSLPARPTLDIVVDTGGVPCPQFSG